MHRNVSRLARLAHPARLVSTVTMSHTPSPFAQLRAWIDAVEANERATGRPADLSNEQQLAIAVLTRGVTTSTISSGASSTTTKRTPKQKKTTDHKTVRKKTVDVPKPERPDADWISLLQRYCDAHFDPSAKPQYIISDVCSITNAQPRFKAECILPIEGDHHPGHFPEEDSVPPFESKKAAKKYAAQCAVAWLMAHRYMPTDCDSVKFRSKARPKILSQSISSSSGRNDEEDDEDDDDDDDDDDGIPLPPAKVIKTAKVTTTMKTASTTTPPQKSTGPQPSLWSDKPTVPKSRDPKQTNHNPDPMTTEETSNGHAGPKNDQPQIRSMASYRRRTPVPAPATTPDSGAPLNEDVINDIIRSLGNTSNEDSDDLDNDKDDVNAPQKQLEVLCRALGFGRPIYDVRQDGSKHLFSGSVQIAGMDLPEDVGRVAKVYRKREAVAILAGNAQAHLKQKVAR